MPFQIDVHEGEAVIEVVYPTLPSAQDVSDYVARIRRAIDAQRGPWACLVDQRELKELPADLLEKVTALNAYARRRGMRASARLVSTARAALQTTKLALDVDDAKVRAFDDREAALAWLRQQLKR